MPVYVYHCTNCGVQFDKLQSFTEQPLVRCPECGKHKLRKVYQPVGIVFKGSGFYATDHHSPSGQAPKTNGKANDKPTDKTNDKTTDKKNGSEVSETTPKE